MEGGWWEEGERVSGRVGWVVGGGGGCGLEGGGRVG